MKTADVNFQAKISRAGNCICDACHDVDHAIKIKLPTTKFFNGNDLSTKYENYWLCAKCRTKLAHALDWPEKED